MAAPKKQAMAAKQAAVRAVKPQPTKKAQKPLKGQSPTKAQGLTPKMEQFAMEYLVDLNATQAYIRSHPSVKETTASTEGVRLLGNPWVAEFIAAERAKSAQKLQITREALLAELWGIVCADANELVQYRRRRCEACWPDDPRRLLAPNPACTVCEGDGIGDLMVADTRNLSPQARALYAGVKVTKEGLEVKMHSKLDAAEKIARHLGLYEKDNEQQGGSLAKAVAAFAAGLHERAIGRLPMRAAKAGPGADQQ